MNVGFILKKAPIVFLLLFFVISFDYAEGERSIRLRRVKTHVAPRHISLSARSGNGIYARRYAYGRPIPNYSTKGKTGKNRRYYSTRGGNGRRRNLSRDYASRYRNWTPNNHPGGRNTPRLDKVSQQKKRKQLYPFLKEPPQQKRRVRPQRFNAMQKPRPPKIPNEYDEDYFFPEEAKRAETKYEFESRFPRPKKKRRPEGEVNFRKPDFSSKIPFYDEKPLQYKKKPRDPPFSYSSFVQHPSGLLDEPENFYEDQDNFFSQPPVRNKKKRVKKKSNSRKKNKDQFKPFVFENDQPEENSPPYLSSDEYELPTKSYKKRNKPSYDPADDEEDFMPQKSPAYSKPKPQANSLFSTDSDFRGSHNTPQTSQFSPSYSQTQWSQPSVVETTARPLQYQTENGFQPQTYNPNQYNYNKDYSSLQKVKTITTNTQQSTYYSQPDNTYKNVGFTNNYNYVNTKASSTQSQTPTNYNTYSGSISSQPTYSSSSISSQPTYSSSVISSQPTYSQPLPSSSSVLTDVTIQKSVPIYDNTETFYNFNNNAYVNSQSSKYYNGDNGGTKYYNGDSGSTKYYDPDQGYGSRLSASATSYRNKLGEKADSDNEFIKKHQNLYNNGLSGVPIQGDGYAKETVKKDYDIGYGDFQFDENPTT